MTHILYRRMPPSYFRSAIDKHIFMLMKMSYRWFLFLPRPPVPRGFLFSCIVMKTIVNILHQKHKWNCNALCQTKHSLQISKQRWIKNRQRFRPNRLFRKLYLNLNLSRRMLHNRCFHTQSNLQCRQQYS